MKESRYTNNPLLRLLECFVLKAIDELSVADAENLTGMQPKLAKIYNRDGTWDEIIAAEMEFPGNMPDLIRKTWERNLVIAKEHGVGLTSQQFAEMFTDHNLV